MYCPNCGKELKHNETFCNNCGTTIFNERQNILRITIISIIILTITTSILAFIILQQTSKSTMALNDNKNYLEKSIIQYPIFTGSRVLVEVKTNNPFIKPNNEIMNATKYRLEQNLINNDYYNPIVQQVAKNKFIIYIEDEFDRKTITKILELQPILEFKKNISNNSYEKETFKNSNLTISDVKKVNYEKINNNMYVVIIEFNKVGTKKFKQLTKELLHKHLAIFINGELMSAPFIQEVIPNGKAQISGGTDGFSLEEAKEITNVLNASLIPTSITIIDIK